MELVMMKMETGGGPPHDQVMEELLRGRKFTNELKDLLLLLLPTSNSDPYPQQDHRRRENDLVAKILYSFKKSISILTHHQRHHRISPHQDSADSLHSSAHKRGRGSYNRIRKGSSDSWTREHSTPNIEDGHSWRKYGQKTIHGHKHHRSYYRCRHKFEQRCPATKQVQQIEDEPAAAKYITTFFGHHTCNLVLKHDHDDDHLVEYYFSNSDQSTADSTSKIMLSFANPSTTHDHHPAAPPATIITGTSNNSTTDNSNMMTMMMNTPQQQRQTSFFSSVDNQGGDFAANSSSAPATTASSHDNCDHLLPSDHDLIATFESALTNFHPHQVDEFDDADVLGFVF